jgi:hypothetical protein
MAFRRCDLQEAFFVPGTHAFRVLGYGTADPLEELLAPGYFAAAGALLRPGDLVYLRAGAGAGREAGVPAAAVHMALLMVRSGAPGSVNVRLVQDFGRSDDPDPAELTPAALPAAAARPATPPRRGRGRPPGSRSKQSPRLASGQTTEVSPKQREVENELLN